MQCVYGGGSCAENVLREEGGRQGAVDLWRMQGQKVSPPSLDRRATQGKQGQVGVSNALACIAHVCLIVGSEQQVQEDTVLVNKEVKRIREEQRMAAVAIIKAAHATRCSK